jgi:hypothetical protein
MRAITIAACFVVLAVSVSAQCGTAPAVDPFAPTACAAGQACQTAFCGCVAAANTSTNALTCLATSAAGCTLKETCLRAYTKCVVGLETQRTSATAVCKTAGEAMHAAVLQAVVGSYAGSALQASCAHHVCQVMNVSSQTCNFGVNASNVCMTPDTTNAFDIVVKIRLSGTAWGQLLNSPVARPLLLTGVRGDVAGLLKVNASYVVILNLTLGSLIIDFAVLAGSSASVAQLEAAVRSSSTNTSWLTSTKSMYSVVSNETITVTDVVLSAGGTTSAPLTVSPPNSTTTSSSTTTTAPGTPGGTSPSSQASSASVLAVAAAVVALLVAM